MTHQGGQGDPVLRHVLEHEGVTVPYGVVRSARRTLAITVQPGGAVVVRAPRAVPDRVIASAVRARGAWIVRAVDAMSSRGPSALYAEGAIFTYAGRPHVLRLERTASTAGPVTLSGGEIRVTTASDPAPDVVKALLDAWMLGQARAELPARAAECWRRFARPGEAQPTLRVRLMRSQWGSLTAGSRMTLNAHLMRASAPCVDSIIYHELCHLRHAGHGPAFYAELAAYAPGWKAHRAELRSLLG